MTLQDYLDKYDNAPYYDSRADIEAEQASIEEQCNKEIEDYERGLL